MLALFLKPFDSSKFLDFHQHFDLRFHFTHLFFISLNLLFGSQENLGHVNEPKLGYSNLPCWKARK